MGGYTHFLRDVHMFCSPTLATADRTTPTNINITTDLKIVSDRPIAERFR